jgi:hypothetical protein
MKTTPLSKQLLIAILSGSYTPYDLREFVRLCSNLALPLIRKKIGSGKLNLAILRMSQQDVLYDSLADLFERDEQGRFVQIVEFFEREQIAIAEHSAEFLLDALRRIVFRRVNTSLIRLHSDADPVLGKILHNLDVAIDRTMLFRKVIRFGESFVIPGNEDLLLQQPPMPFEYLQERFSRVVLLYESMPAMLKKLHSLLLGQHDHQRAVSFVSVGLMFKDVYKLAQKSEEAMDTAEYDMEAEADQKVIEKVSEELRRDFAPRYVEKGKMTKEQFEQYIETVKRVLCGGVEGGEGNISLFESLLISLPELTKQEYAKQHRSVVEYLCKDAKKRLRKEIKGRSSV